MAREINPQEQSLHLLLLHHSWPCRIHRGRKWQTPKEVNTFKIQRASHQKRKDKVSVLLCTGCTSLRSRDFLFFFFTRWVKIRFLVQLSRKKWVVVDNTKSKEEDEMITRRVAWDKENTEAIPSTTENMDISFMPPLTPAHKHKTEVWSSMTPDICC